MPKSFFFSINLLIKSDSHLEKCIDSVMHDEAFFLENIQLILIDSLCSQYSLEVCTKYSRKYPENVYFVDASGKTDGEGYNDAKSLCMGTYLCYANNYGEFSKQTFPELLRLLKNGRIPVICIQPCYAPSGKGVQSYILDKTPGLVDLRQNPDRFCMMLGSYFFHRKTVQSLLFDTSAEIHNNVKFIAEALMINYSYIFHPGCTYTTNTPCELEPFKYVQQYNRQFYTQSVDNFIIPMLKAYVGSALVQSMMLYLLEIKFSLNADERYKHVIIGNYVDEFFDKVSEALNLIDDGIILNKKICRMCGLDDEMPFRLIRLKYKNKELKPDIDIAPPKAGLEQSYFCSNGRMERTVLNGEFIASVNRAAVGGSKDINAEIASVNYDEEGLYIDAILYGCSFLNEKDYRVFVNINGEKNDVITSRVYTLKKFFDRPFLKRYAFRFFVPVSSGKTMDTFYLTMKYGRLSFRIGMTFNSVFSRLSSEIHNSYWLFRDRVMTYDRKTRSVVIRRASDILVHRCESKFLAEAGQLVSMSERLYYRQMRKAARNAEQEKLDHRYIMFYDENGIDSNGNVLFRYFSKYKSNEKLEVFFTAIRGSDEQEFLVDSEYENVLEAGSKKAKLTALCADVIVASDCDVYESLSFNPTDILFLKDLFKARIVSVKDFFITYATAQFDNRLRDNIQLFFCASENEREHILRDAYDYDESMIRITGYPVLDTLSDKKESLILIAPVERRQFCIYNNSDQYRFSESRFFKLYNKLLMDPGLLRKLRERNCKLAFLVPGSIEKFSGLFYSSDNVRIYSYTGRNAHELIGRASLLITDNSDLQYPFAYMNKPVAYYYPHGLPIQQEFKDEGLSKNSFGELFFDHASVIDFIIKSIDNGFPQQENYSKQCRDFFRYHDNNNSRRVFKSIISTFFPDIYKGSAE